MQDAVFFDRTEQKCSFHGGLNDDALLPDYSPGGVGIANDEWGMPHDFFYPLRSYRTPFRQGSQIFANNILMINACEFTIMSDKFFSVVFNLCIWSYTNG